MAEARGPGLYDPRNEHDACGVGFVANIKGRKSHDIIRRGLQILVNLDHRGAVGADPLVGDGAGCMIQMPDALLRDWAGERGLDLPPPGRYAVAMCFLPMDAGGARRRDRACSSISSAPRARACSPGARSPIDTTGLGKRVIETMPYDRAGDRRGQRRTSATRTQFERKILTIRKQVLNSVGQLAEKHGLPALRRSLHAVLLDPHGGLQGPAARAAGRELLRRSAQPADRVGAGAGASALLDQHLPVLAAGAPVPLHLPQRRDQHGARQRQLDGGAAAGDVVGAARAPISTRWCR